LLELLNKTIYIYKRINRAAGVTELLSYSNLTVTRDLCNSCDAVDAGVCQNAVKWGAVSVQFVVGYENEMKRNVRSTLKI